MFGTDTNMQQADRGNIRGRQEEVACDCWFSSTGRTIPRFIKYQDMTGVIHSIHDIRVIESERQIRCGIPVVMYRCVAEEGGRQYRFRLFFHLEDCQWKVVWEGTD